MCKRYYVWWRDGARGLISVHDTLGVNIGAFIIGINNAIFSLKSDEPSAEDYQKLIDATPDTYLFKTRRSLVVRIVPGHSTDSKWDDQLP